MTTPLYHVGCGRHLFDQEDLERGTMAMACACGADAPIVTNDLLSANISFTSLPGSLIKVMLEHKTPPHLEYYLGFDSDFMCIGSIAFAECSEERCQREPERRAERARHYEARN